MLPPPPSLAESFSADDISMLAALAPRTDVPAPKTLDVRSYYMTAAHDDSDTMIDKATRALEDVDYDTMVGTGLSGSLVVPVLARALGKHWLIMRKPSDGTHSDAPGEGTLGERWVFVDDFVASGTTRKRVRAGVEALATAHEFTTTFVGSYLYRAEGTFKPRVEDHDD